MRLFVVYLLLTFTFGQQFAQAQADVSMFKPELREDLLMYRDCILANPDSCSELYDDIVNKGMQYQDVHAIAKATLLKGISNAYHNDLPKAIRCFQETIQICDYLDSATTTEVYAYANIGNMYLTQGDSAFALRYLTQSLPVARELGDSAQVAVTRIQIAQLQVQSGDYETAIHNLRDVGVEIKKQNYESLPFWHLSMSDYHKRLGNHDSALIYAQNAYDLYSPHDDAIGMVSSEGEIGLAYLALGEIDKAIKHCTKSYEGAIEHSLILWEEDGCECLFEAYLEKNNHKEALKYHTILTELKESIKNDDRLRELTAIELELDFAKERMADSLKTAEENKLLKKQQEHQLQEEKSKAMLSYIGVGAVGVVAFMLFIGLRSKKRDNQIISQQKLAVEEKQREILDSISYAKRLQDAILPSPSLVNPYFPESFVLFLPRDGVSGDFYWFDIITHNNEKYFLFAVADCTGHGVPGAMVSVVCSNALTRAVTEFKCQRPGDILDKVALLVQDTFKSDFDKEVRDGMDIALCAINESKTKLLFSGANNPLWLVRSMDQIPSSNQEQKGFRANPDNQVGLIEIRGNRQPIGITLKQKSFDTQEIELLKGDLLYLFSDGYADQFGGDKGKKLKYSNFKELILKYSSQEMEQQKMVLESSVREWQGEIEQTDDICVMGIRI